MGRQTTPLVVLFAKYFDFVQGETQMIWISRFINFFLRKPKKILGQKLNPSDYPLRVLRRVKYWHSFLSYDVDLSQYFERFSKVKPAPTSYKIAIVRGSGRSHDFSDVYRDTEFTLILYDGEILSGSCISRSIACIGFDVVKPHKKRAKPIIFIRQIQGVYGKKQELAAFRWEKMLVQIIVDWARVNGFSEARIQLAEHNRYYDQVGSRDSLRLRYNITARRSGFRLNEARNYYVLELD